MDGQYKDRKDKCNIVVGMTDSEFREFIIDYLLGDTCNSENTLSQEQMNEIALHTILERYSYKYWKEFKGTSEDK